MKKLLIIYEIFLITGLVLPMNVISQELEPWSLVNLPVGMNFIAAGYGYGQGNILLNLSIPLEDFDGKSYT